MSTTSLNVEEAVRASHGQAAEWLITESLCPARCEPAPVGAPGCWRLLGSEVVA